MSQPSATNQPTAEITPVAAVLAWLWPGAGHIALGERRRGIWIMVGILFLFISGLLIGGVDAVDRREARVWFLAQSLNGPIAFAADQINQRVIKARPEDQRLWTTGIGRVNEIGTLFIALAGLLNLAVILDALHFIPRQQPPPRRRRSDDKADAAASPAEGDAKA